ncbi:MAG: VWA domain-containing protein [Acidobacteria bacterium]|nr:VWA domain-containing protein [Acidobacteriota bacterium]
MAITRRVWLSSCISLLPAWAQQPVTVLATVRDKQGNVVRDLPRETFTLLEDGETRDIQTFSQQSNLPLTLGLLVDTSGRRPLTSDERLACWKLFEQVLREDRDQAFVIHFDFDVELLADLTGSKTTIQRTLDKLGAAARSPQLQRRVEGGAQQRRNTGTSLYDSILLASDEILIKQPGRKAILLLSDGVDTGSRTTIEDAIESAQRADTMVYAIRFIEQSGTGSRDRERQLPPGVRLPDGRKVLQRIAAETGGGFFDLTGKHQLDEFLRRIEEELRNQYNIGFSPTKADPGTFHTIKLTAKQKNLLVQTRAGYYTSR